MLRIDGAGGGGQLVRTALSLSAVTGRSFRMEGVREGRPEPGLRPQHLAAVRAVGAATDAEADGVAVGSTTLEFYPSSVEPGRYAVDVGTAGSLPLVFDAVLPLAATTDGRIALAARGGTDVRWAPTMDSLRFVKLPLLRRSGLVAAVDLTARGFYPAGGGSARLTVGPSSMTPVAPVRRDSPATARVYSVSSTSLAGRKVAERQADAAVEGLEDAGVSVVGRAVEYAETASPGSAVTLRLERDGRLAGADALGERGTPAEAVGAAAVDAATAWLASGADVDANLADQLLIYLGLAGGEVSIPAVTDHVRSSLPVLEAFDCPVALDETTDPPVLRA